MMDRAKPFLSVVIPCYNEEQNLNRNVLGEVHDYLKAKQYSWEVIVSDDGSTDSSRSIVRSQITKYKGFKLLDNLHGGKPAALMSGINGATGKYILFTDMDQSTPISELDKMIPFLDKNYDVVIGSRGLKRKDFPSYRKVGAALFSAFRRALILSEIADTQCGFKLFRKEPLAKSFPKLEFLKKKDVVGWAVTSFDVELLHIMKKLGCRIKEVKVAWTDKDTSTGKGGALKKYFKESREMVVQILRVKLNDLRGFYG